ncbi:MAG: signal peptidase I [Tannerellaceae bacterium]|jgi:signal peptidase I|nr:signal peptidase I [Tannerellaceae bacterium]
MFSRWLLPLLLAAGLILAVRQWCVASYRISTPAMEKALRTGDFVLANKWTGRMPERNRTVLFTAPPLRNAARSPLLVSRCAGTPGDTIEIEAEEGYTRKVTLPRRGKAYRLDAYSLPFCRDAIMQETGGKAQFRNGKLYMDGRETLFFYFAHDYYWLLSDNPEAAVDSRHLGIIPEDHLVGSVFFIWFSADRNRAFTRVR